MRSIDIFYAIGNVSDELIEKTAFITPRAQKRYINKRLLLAACIATALLLGTVGMSTFTTLKEILFATKQTETETEQNRFCADGMHSYTVGNTCDICGFAIPVTEGLEYEVNGSECGVTGIGSATDVHVYIPAFYGESRVTYIGNDAFADCTRLDGVVLPDTITAIYGGAFRNCSRLENMTIPNSVTVISAGAFDGCVKLLELHNEVLYADKWAVRADKSILEVEIRQGTVGIADSTFEDCTMLSSIVIPEGVRSVGYKAFKRCLALTEILIPDCVISLGDEAFMECVRLKNVYVGNGVTSIGKDTFNTCRRLESIKLVGSITSIGETAFYRCEALKEINIPQSVNSIGANAFSECKNLVSITIPDGVEIIKYGTFRDCARLESVRLGSGLASIEAYAFEGCEWLINVTVPSSVKEIDRGAFENCRWLSNVTFEDAEGWSVEGKPIDVSRPSVNAINLSETYKNNKWTKAE